MLDRKPHTLVHLGKLAFVFVLFQIPLVSQTLQKQILNNRKNLNNIKGEIKAYENKLSLNTAREKTEIEKLNDVGEKIGLLQQLVGELESAERLTEKNIAELRLRLAETSDELTTLKSLMALRLIQMYKHRADPELAYVFTSDSWTQAYARNKYLKIIAEQDRRDVQNLRDKKVKIEGQKKQIEAELVIQQDQLSQKKAEKKNLDRELAKRRNSIAKIRKDKKLMSSLISQRKDDLEGLQAIIAVLEKKKAEEEAAERERRRKLAEKLAKTTGTSKSNETYKEPVYEEKSTFGLYKGKLAYPVAGKIVEKFGDHYNASLGTTTRNPGVDILSVEGARVRAVAKGKVSVISWLRRLGNTIILDHGAGFYTVYAHLSEIYVSPDQTVVAGESLANLDESDDGKAILHFEVYENRVAQDPSMWLK